MNYIEPIYKTVGTITSKMLINFYDFRNFSGETVYRFDTTEKMYVKV